VNSRLRISGDNVEQECTQSLEKLQIFVDGGQRAARFAIKINRHADAGRNKRARDALLRSFHPQRSAFPRSFLPHNFRGVSSIFNFFRGFIVTLAENINFSFDTPAPAGERDIEYSGVKARDSGAHISAFSPLFFPAFFSLYPIPWGIFHFFSRSRFFTRFCTFTRRECTLSAIPSALKPTSLSDC